MTNNYKRTPFVVFHEQLGARMVPFAGFYMPLHYHGVMNEHVHVRRKVGVFDVSHMGEIWVEGPAAQAFTQYLTSNDVMLLYDGKVQYSCLLNEKGGIVDDLLVYQFNPEKYLLVVNAANIEKDWSWLCTNADKFGIVVGKHLINKSDEIAQLAVQGPLAMKLVQKLCDDHIEDMTYYTFKELKLAGCDVILSTTGYTGAGGCEIYLKNEDAARIWNALFEVGSEFELKPIGLGARDSLRLEMGFCLYGNDIDENTTPIEAGLGWITKFNENNNFICREILKYQKDFGATRYLRGFEMTDKAIPRPGYIIKDLSGTQIGHVTSGIFSPSLQKPIGLGYVQADYANYGMEIYIDIRDNLHKATIVKLPFWKG